MKKIYSFLIALQFLTRFPVSLRFVPEERTVGHSLLFYPLVGLLLGSALAILNLALGDISDSLRAAMILGVWVLLTGALHLDGLADSADAWVGGIGSRERTLTIMKDPYCGPAAVVTLLVVLMMKFSALQTLEPGAWTTLVLIPTVARAAIPLLFITTPYVRPGGLGASLATNAPRTACAIVVVGTVLFAIFLGRTTGLWLVLAMGGIWALARHMMIRRLGGTTGDTTGALVELGETAMLVTGAIA